MRIIKLASKSKEIADQLNNDICKFLSGHRGFIDNDIIVTPVEKGFVDNSVRFIFEIILTNGDWQNRKVATIGIDEIHFTIHDLQDATSWFIHY